MAERIPEFEIVPIGVVRSVLRCRSQAPRQASEGAPNAELAINPQFAAAVEGLECVQEIWVFTWFHEADRGVLKVHPRGRRENPLTGVFATRSPDRPNPIGLHRAKIVGIDHLTIRVEALEAIDGTPVVDIKPTLVCEPERGSFNG